MTEKKASTNYPIHELLAERWSPYIFEDRPVLVHRFFGFTVRIVTC